MEAIILAGGFGTRLRPLTYTRAKSLIPILNRPMITHIIDLLPNKVDKVILAVNYRKDQIEEYFKKNDCGKKIIVNDEPKPLGTGGATKFAQEHITGRFLVINSDVICSLNLEDMIKFHKDNNAVATISLWPVENVSEFGVVDIKENGNVTGFVEKPKPEDAPSNLINAGAYFLEPEILDYIQKGRLVSMEKEIFPQIIEKTGRFYGYQFKGYWTDIGRISSYLEVNKFLLEKSNMKNCIGKNSETNALVNNSSVGNNVKISPSAKIDSSIILNDAIVGEDTELFNCVIGEKSKINKKSKIKNSVIGDNEIVKDNTTLDNKIIWTQQKPKGYPDKQIGNVIEKE